MTTACSSQTRLRPGQKPTGTGRKFWPHRQRMRPRRLSHCSRRQMPRPCAGDLAAYLISSEREALAPGSQGWWDDTCLLKPWGFDLADITVPVLLLHGRQDMFVPFGHGKWLAAHIPGVEARLLDDDGHLTLLQNRVPEVHAWLSEYL